MSVTTEQDASKILWFGFLKNDTLPSEQDDRPARMVDNGAYGTFTPTSSKSTSSKSTSSRSNRLLLLTQTVIVIFRGTITISIDLKSLESVNQMEQYLTSLGYIKEISIQVNDVMYMEKLSETITNLICRVDPRIVVISPITNTKEASNGDLLSLELYLQQIGIRYKTSADPRYVDAVTLTHEKVINVLTLNYFFNI